MKLRGRPSPGWSGWLVGGGAVAVSVALRAGPLAAVAVKAPYVLFFPAIVVAALSGGVYPGITATAACAIAATYWLPPEGRAFAVHDPVDLLSLAVFVVSSLLISAVCEAMHRAMKRSQAAETQLKVSEERRRADDAVERYELLARHSRDIILFVRKADGRIVECNQAAEQAYGRTREELCTLSIHDIRLPGDRILTEWQMDVADTAGALFETIHRRKDGTTFPVEVSSTGSTMGGERYVLSVIRDITTRKKVDDARREAEANMRAILDAASEAIYLFDLNGTILSANETAAARLSSTPAEVVGTSFTDYMSAEAAEKRWSVMRQVVSTGETQRFEDERDGMVLDQVVSPVFDSDGAVNRIAVFTRDVTARNRIEAEFRRMHASVQEEKDRLAALVDSMVDEVWFADTNGTLTLANPSAVREFNLSSPGQTNVSELAASLEVYRTDGTRRPISEAPMLRALAGEEVRNEEVIVRTPATGELRYRQTSSSPVRDAEGKIIGSVSVVRDVTDRKRAEADLRRNQDELAEAQRLAHMGSWTWDAQTDSAAGTDELYAIFGQDPPANPLRPFTEQAVRFFPPESWRSLKDAMQETLATGVGREMELEGTRNGEPIWIAGRIEAVRDADGRITGLRGTAQDVTERKRDEARLRSSEQLYRAIGESIDYGVWVCDPDGRNTYASESFLKLVGLTQAQCSDFGWGAVLHPDDSERTIAAWKECVRTGGNWDIEHRFRGVDGQWHAILARGVPVRNEDGEVVCWAGINLDISLMKQAEEALERADRAKDEFLAILSHELRNPLSTISNAAALIALQADHNPAIRKPLSVLNNTVRDAGRLVDDILDTSRITHGMLELRIEAIDLVPKLRDAAEGVADHMRALNHSFTAELPEGPVWVEADAMRLNQAVGNLLRNAAKFTDPGGVIILSLREQDGEATICVRDNGPGIEPAMLDRVFDRFTQEGRLVHRSRGGLGIGLALARSLVELHGGTVEARSDGPGNGSEFIIRLATSAPGIPAESRQTPPAPRPTKRILVVDDNVPSAEMLARVLESWGHAVEFVHDGKAAIDAAGERRPAVVLLDIGLPDMDGCDVARTLRRDLGASLMLIAVTGYGQEQDRLRSADAGFNHHLVKPLNLDALRELLAQDASASD